MNASLPPVLYDSHCHFDADVFAPSRDAVWRDCQQVGIRQLLIPGTNPQQWRHATRLANVYEGIVMAAGLHPWWLASSSLPSVDEWQQYLQLPCCVAIGECGLDALIDVPMDQQRQVFVQHLQMAVELSMPLIVHVRACHNETLALLKEYAPASGGVIHGFTGSYELAMQYWRMGFYLGIGGSITYTRAQKTRAMAASVPLEALLLETDAPDMPLAGFQGQANSPLRLLDVAHQLAELRSESLAKVALQTTQNSCQLFSTAVL